MGKGPHPMGGSPRIPERHATLQRVRVRMCMRWGLPRHSPGGACASSQAAPPSVQLCWVLAAPPCHVPPPAPLPPVGTDTACEAGLDITGLHPAAPYGRAPRPVWWWSFKAGTNFTPSSLEKSEPPLEPH